MTLERDSLANQKRTVISLKEETLVFKFSVYQLSPFHISCSFAFSRDISELTQQDGREKKTANLV